MTVCATRPLAGTAKLPPFLSTPLPSCPVHVLPSPHCPQEDSSWPKPQTAGEKEANCRLAKDCPFIPLAKSQLSSGMGRTGMCPHIPRRQGFLLCDVCRNGGTRGEAQMRDERVSPHTLHNVWQTHHTSRCGVSRDCMCPCRFCVTGCLPDVPCVYVFVGWCVPEFQLLAWYMLAVPCV